jgi:pilus assembly protein CpaB
MRDKRFIIVIAFAVVFGLVAAGLVGRYLSNLEGRSTKVVVAKVNIPLSTMITADQLTIQQFPRAITPEGIFTNPDKLIGRVTINNIGVHEPLTDLKLAPVGSEAGLTGVIAEGFRAITVKVDDVVGIAGLVNPGSWVDIVAVITPEGQSSNQGPTSKIVLQHIRVLATNQDIEQSSEKGQKDKKDSTPATIKAVTLQVLPEQAEKLALAQAEGKLQLVMRNSVDKDEVQTAGSNKRSLLNGDHVVAVPELAAAKVLTESKADKPPSGMAPAKGARARRGQPPSIFMPSNEKENGLPRAAKPRPTPARNSVEVFESGKRRTVEFP